MKYPYESNPVPQNRRKDINEKILYLIDSKTAESKGITPTDIFSAYTGDGGLHGLERKDFENYHEYSEAKKEIEHGRTDVPWDPIISPITSAYFLKRMVCRIFVSTICVIRQEAYCWKMALTSRPSRNF